jgi:methionyl aminopeptidase
MKNDIYEKYIRAGKIARESMDFGADLIKPGASFLNVAEQIESKILEKGASISFPVNISINEIAAHYSPRSDDKLKFNRGDIVKLDVGSHIDGYIADTAMTVEVETREHDEMIKASSDALDAAIESMRAGINLSDIGKIVENVIRSNGFKPIDNLTGHSLGRYKLHSGMSVPSVSNSISKEKPKVDDVIAIEPFATDGSGHVISGKGSNIYIMKQGIKTNLIRDNRSKILFNKMKSRFRTLPFAQRWFTDISNNVNISLKKLSFLGMIKHYPQLIEQKGGIVTQKEHTVIITEEGCEVITTT